MQLWTSLSGEKQKFQGGVVTLGNFDGLHLGHQSLLRRALNEKGPRIVITFNPHPLQVLRPESGLKRIFPREDLSEQLPRFGVDLLVVLPFTRELAATPAPDFWRKFVMEPFAPRAIVAGHDFGFGAGRSGTLKDMTEWSKPASVHVMQALHADGTPVSSRRVRELIEKGDVTQAAHLLGRAFYLRGELIEGAARGRTIGVPTLNMKPVNEILPALGVYATRTRIAGLPAMRSVTNIGVNPTFGGKTEIKVETHVIGREIQAPIGPFNVDFLGRIRPEMKFNSIEDLKKQIQSDILKANEAVDIPQPD
jgi:riboflavin kinase/FMN adenylyltransferase